LSTSLTRPAPERLQNYEQHLLHEILRGGAVPQMAKAVGADPVRIPLADGALVLGFHEVLSTTARPIAR
jgi:hypothetical protein